MKICPICGKKPTWVRDDADYELCPECLNYVIPLATPQEDK